MGRCAQRVPHRTRRRSVDHEITRRIVAVSTRCHDVHKRFSERRSRDLAPTRAPPEGRGWRTRTRRYTSEPV